MSDESINGTDRFPDNVPEDLGDLVSAVYEEHEFHNLYRSAAGDRVSGATWRSDNEDVTVMNYGGFGYWTVEASRREFDEDRSCLVTHGKSGGAVDGLDREAAFRLANYYMSGEIELTNGGPSEDKIDRATAETERELLEQDYATPCPNCGGVVFEWWDSDFCRDCENTNDETSTRQTTLIPDGGAERDRCPEYGTSVTADTVRSALDVAEHHDAKRHQGERTAMINGMLSPSDEVANVNRTRVHLEQAKFPIVCNKSVETDLLSEIEVWEFVGRT